MIAINNNLSSFIQPPFLVHNILLTTCQESNPWISFLLGLKVKGLCVNERLSVYNVYMFETFIIISRFLLHGLMKPSSINIFLMVS